MIHDLLYDRVHPAISASPPLSLYLRVFLCSLPRYVLFTFLTRIVFAMAMEIHGIKSP